MRDVDLVRVRQLLSNIAEAQSQLRELGQLAETEFLGDFRNTESAKYLLIVTTEAAIDLCNHIVARRGKRAPQDYADCFAVMAELGVITPELATQLKRMARFRNLIVHLYWKVDNQLVYEVIQNNLDDLDAFRQQLSNWLAL